MYRLRCFGRICIEGAGGDDHRLRSQKHLALLTYLLAHRGRSYPRKRLASLFWDTEPRLARHSLSQALYDIRTELPDIDLRRTTTHVAIGGNGLVYDAEDFEDAVRDNDLKRAVSLYEGEFAPDLEDAGNGDFERWLESERGRLRRLAEMALYRHVRACDDRARWGEMCISAVRLLDMNPLNEEAHRALMRGLWLQGDQLAAVRHFEEVEDFLARELPGGVGDETAELLQRIRSSRPKGDGRAVRDGIRPDMVGREEEFESLKRALEETCHGTGRLVRVWGEAGIGKTRLLEAFRELTALESVRVLASRCYSAESDVPYGPVVDGLEEVAGELFEESDSERTYYQLGHLFPDTFDRPADDGDAFAEPDAGRRRLYEETADVLRRVCAETPVVWLVEDVHWIDASSGSLLHYLSRRLSRHPFLLVVTARTHEATGEASRALLDEDLASVDVRELHLDPLNPQQVRQLADFGRDEPLEETTVAKIHKLAGGNTFYAQEILRSSSHLQDERAVTALENPSPRLISENLRALLNRRLRGLSPKAVRILEAVATAGRHATPSLVSDAAGLTREEIAELSGVLYSRGLLRDTEDGLEFFHDITREFIYGNMGQLQRAALHLTVGELLAKRVDRIGAAALARHFQKAGDDGRAYEYALRAACEAEERHAHEEAIQMATLALEAAEGEDERVEALGVLANAELAGGNLNDAKVHWEELVGTVDDTDSRSVHCHLKYSQCLLELGEWPAAELQLETIGRRLYPPTQQTVKDYAHSLHHQVKLGLLSNREPLLDETIVRVKALRDNADGLMASPTAKALTLCSLGAHSLYASSSQRALEYLSETDQLLDDVSEDLRIRCVMLAGIAAYRLARWDIAEVKFKYALTLSERYNDVIANINSLNNLSGCKLDQGDWRRLTEYYKKAMELAKWMEHNGYACIIPSVNYANSLLYRSRYATAADVILSLLDRLEKGVEWTWIATELNATLGLCYLAVGKSDQARGCRRTIASCESWLGVQNRVNAAWLEAYFRYQQSPTFAAEYMAARAKHEVNIDRVSGRRMQALVELFGRRVTSEQDWSFSESVEKSLKDISNGWFLHFSRRWMRRVLHHRI